MRYSHPASRTAPPAQGLGTQASAQHMLLGVQWRVLIRRCVMIGIALTLILVGMAISYAIGGQLGDILRGYSSTKPLKSQPSAAPTASLNESVGLHCCKLHQWL